MNAIKQLIHPFALALAVLALPLAAQAAPATTTAGGKIGTLTCTTIPNTTVNLLIHSTVNVKCVFKSTAGETEHYKGETGVGLGIDLHVKRDEKLAFVVLAADFKKGTYKLAGKYGGAGGTATVGVGVGAHVLIGGSNNSVSLEPIVLSGSKGIGVSGGITYLYLEPDREAD